MRTHWIPAWAALAALAAPAVALAQVSAAREQTFRERDRNGDGVLTQEEYGGHPGNFRAMDVNGDRVLSRDEFVNRYRDGDQGRNGDDAVVTTAPPLVATDTFAVIDVNGDRAIARSEWRADLAPATFARLDRNHDGLVTRDEFVSPLPVGSAEARFGDLDRNNDGFISRGEWVGESLSFNTVDWSRDGRITIDEYLDPRSVNPTSSTWERRFAERDRNRDGVLSRTEWRGETSTFDRADRNRDGVVTLREYLVSPVSDTTTPTLRDRFYSLDRNRNGSVSIGEWPYGRDEFETLDRNRDGRLTQAEYVSQQALDNPTSDPYVYSNVVERFRQLDANGDASLSRAEWNVSLQTFMAADRNRDGVVSLEEFREY